jgi:DNA-binding response OmpR family regulator
VRPHVLLVEDSALVVGALRILLEESGHRVSAASTTRAAVDIARADRPDIMLLDLSLGQEDGLQVLRELAKTGDAPPVTVAVTGHDVDAVRARCVEAGCIDVLVKPIGTRELVGKIREWTGQYGRA